MKGNAEILASYKQGYAAIVASEYGRGRTVLFSPHPEGSGEAEVKPDEIGTLKLLQNAIAYTLNFSPASSSPGRAILP